MTATLSTNTETVASFENFPSAAKVLHLALSGKFRVICLEGTIRSGKSFTGVSVLTLLHKLYPGTRSIVVRDTLETLKKNTLPTCHKAIPNNFIKNFNGSNYSWEFTNGSFMQFFAEQSSTDPERKRWNGLEVNFILLDQIEEIEEKTFDKALERLGSYFVPKSVGRTPPPVIICTVNPTFAWPREVFYKPSLDNTLPPNWLMYKMDLRDNPHVEPSFIESLQELKRKNPIKYIRFVEGDWDVKEKDGNEWISEFFREKHVKEVDYVPGYPLHLSWDFNAVPYMTCTVYQLFEVNGIIEIRALKEYCYAAPKNSIAAIAKDIKADFPRASVFYYGDASGNNRIAGFGNLTQFGEVEKELIGLTHNTSKRTNKKNPGLFEARDFMNRIFDNKYRIRIVVSPKCKNLIGDLEGLKESVNGYNPVKVRDAQGFIYESLGHTYDSLVYLTVKLFGHLMSAKVPTP